MASIGDPDDKALVTPPPRALIVWGAAFLVLTPGVLAMDDMSKFGGLASPAHWLGMSYVGFWILYAFDVCLLMAARRHKVDADLFHNPAGMVLWLTNLAVVVICICASLVAIVNGYSR